MNTKCIYTKYDKKTQYSPVYSYRMLQFGSHPHITKNALIKIDIVIYVLIF